MKIALITGASRGIGAAIAMRLAKEGYRTILTASKDEEGLHKIKEEIHTLYQMPCETYLCDMGNFEAVKALFQTIPEIDVLINNAGISYFGLLSDMDVSDWKKIMACNLDSCFYTAKFAIPSMVKKQSGKIINISSVWGNAGSSLEVAYSTSKGGINAFTKALAKELAPSNIQVNAIAPGMIDTAMNACLTAEDIASIKEEIPADRIGTCDEVAELCLQVINSPSYMTGQIISLDGGWI